MGAFCDSFLDFSWDSFHNTSRDSVIDSSRDSSQDSTRDLFPKFFEGFHQGFFQLQDSSKIPLWDLLKIPSLFLSWIRLEISLGSFRNSQAFLLGFLLACLPGFQLIPSLLNNNHRISSGMLPGIYGESLKRFLLWFFQRFFQQSFKDSSRDFPLILSGILVGIPYGIPASFFHGFLPGFFLGIFPDFPSKFLQGFLSGFLRDSFKDFSRIHCLGLHIVRLCMVIQELQPKRNISVEIPQRVWGSFLNGYLLRFLRQVFWNFLR